MQRPRRWAASVGPPPYRYRSPTVPNFFFPVRGLARLQQHLPLTYDLVACKQQTRETTPPDDLPRRHITKLKLTTKMSTSKRKFSDYTSGADGRGPSDSRQYAKKRTKSRHGKGGDQDMKNLNQLKKRTRNIERLFKKAENLPANKRVDLERELAHYKQKIVEAEDEKKTKKMITKYHMVRFFGMPLHCSQLLVSDIGCPVLTAASQRERRPTDSPSRSRSESSSPRTRRR